MMMVLMVEKEGIYINKKSIQRTKTVHLEVKDIAIGDCS
jgi:hypothetical protein